MVSLVRVHNLLLTQPYWFLLSFCLHNQTHSSWVIHSHLYGVAEAQQYLFASLQACILAPSPPIMGLHQASCPPRTMSLPGTTHWTPPPLPTICPLCPRLRTPGMGMYSKPALFQGSRGAPAWEAGEGRCPAH